MAEGGLRAQTMSQGVVIIMANKALVSISALPAKRDSDM